LFNPLFGKKAMPHLSVLCYLALTIIGATVFSDVVYLKDGGKVEGIIIQQTPEKVVVNIGVGEMEFDSTEIDSIVLSGKDEKKQLEKEWAESKDINEKYYKEAQKAHFKKPKQKKYKLRDVVVLSAEWCVYCKRAAELFKANKIPYKILDIEKSQEGLKLYKKLGGGGIPIIIIGNRAIRGLDIPAINAALQTKEARKLH